MTPSTSDQLLKSALAHHQKGRLPEAAALYRRVRAAYPRNFDAVHLGGLVALQQGDAASAVPLLAQARRLNPASAPACLRLGIALGVLRRPAEAEEALRAALALDPKGREAWYHLGGILRQLGRLG